MRDEEATICVMNLVIQDNQRRLPNRSAWARQHKDELVRLISFCHKSGGRMTVGVLSFEAIYLQARATSKKRGDPSTSRPTCCDDDRNSDGVIVRLFAPGRRST